MTPQTGSVTPPDSKGLQSRDGFPNYPVHLSLRKGEAEAPGEKKDVLLFALPPLPSSTVPEPGRVCKPLTPHVFTHVSTYTHAPAQASVPLPLPHPLSCYCLPSQAGAGSFLGDGRSPGCRQPSRQYEDRRPRKGPGSERPGWTLIYVIYDIKKLNPTCLPAVGSYYRNGHGEGCEALPPESIPA